MTYGTPIDLGALPDYPTMSTASDINNDGVIVGQAFLPAGDEANSVAVWWPTPSSGPQRLDRALGFAEIAGSTALRINDRGQILVSGSTMSTDDDRMVRRTFVVDPISGSSTEVIIPYAMDPWMWMAGMNDDGDVVSGVIVAMSQDAEGQHAVVHAVRWDFSTGEALDLGTLPGDESSWAYAINDAGQVVGRSADRPFYWDPATGIMHELASNGAGEATSINNRGQAAGTIAGRAVMWDLSTGEMTDLGVIGSAMDINDAGQILGVGGPLTSWLWDPSSRTVVQLPDNIANVAAINDHLQVVGISNARAALWNPIQRTRSE